MPRKSCPASSIPTCSNTLNLSDPFPLTWFHVSWKRSTGKRSKRKAYRTPPCSLSWFKRFNTMAQRRLLAAPFAKVSGDRVRIRDGKWRTSLMTLGRKCIRQVRFRPGILCSATKLASEMTRRNHNVRPFPLMVSDRRGPCPCSPARKIGQHCQA